jgi:hypothetical protein
VDNSEGTEAASSSIPQRASAWWALNTNQLPTLVKVPDLDKVMCLDDDQFRFGLRLLVDGLAHEFGI